MKLILYKIFKNRVMTFYTIVDQYKQAVLCTSQQQKCAKCGFIQIQH